MISFGGASLFLNLLTVNRYLQATKETLYLERVSRRHSNYGEKNKFKQPIKTNNQLTYPAGVHQVVDSVHLSLEA